MPCSRTARSSHINYVFVTKATVFYRRAILVKGLHITNYLKRMFKMNKERHQRLTQAAQLHRVNLRKNLERRLEAAKASGDQKLIQILEAESSYIG